MTGSIPALIRATTARTKLPRVHCEQRGRSLQDAGLLPVMNGRTHIPARPRDMANLLIALAVDRVRKAPAFLNQYATLEKIRWHRQFSAPDEPNPPERAGDAIELLVAAIWGGSREHVDKTITIIQTWPEIVIDGDHYYPAGAIMEHRGLLDVRRSLEIPGCVIAQIGADLGHKGCRYAV